MKTKALKREFANIVVETKGLEEKSRLWKKLQTSLKRINISFSIDELINDPELTIKIFTILKERRSRILEDRKKVEKVACQDDFPF